MGAARWPSLAVLILALSPARLAAQSSRDTLSHGGDSVTVTAGPQYRAGWLHEVLFGEHYRALWATPLAVERLDLARFAGGLVPVRRGGGGQTQALRLAGADGRQYVFRSVDKRPAWLPADLQATVAERVLKDQLSVLHPAAALVAAPLLDAAGVLHAAPHLLVMPDDPRLGEFRTAFAGMLGLIEERPNEGQGGQPGFGGSSDIVGTARLLEHLEHGARHRVDSRAYLAARLIDLYLADGDRHADQWRWARFEEGDYHVWRPIPRDRDEAFARFDGLLPRLARSSNPELVGFGPDYGSVYGLSWRAQDLDRRLLGDLGRAVWDSTARTLQARLTDSVIDAAVRQLPPEYYRLNGAQLARDLKRRRDALPAAALGLYALLAHDADIHATDEPDVAAVERLDDQRVAVHLYRRAEVGSAGLSTAYFTRTFDRAETQEIRLHLHGGADHVVVRGAVGHSILVRVISGGGADTLEDSSRVGSGGHLTRFYNTRGADRIVRGPGTRVDRRRYVAAAAPDRFHAGPRDWGHEWRPLAWLSSGADVGVLVGGGVTLTTYGFRHVPYRSRALFRVAYASGAGRLGAELRGDFRSALHTTLRVRGSGFDIVRFYGIGNETPLGGTNDFYKAQQTQYVVQPALVVPISRATELTIGPQLKYARTDPVPGTFISINQPYGSGRFGQVGVQAAIRIDTRDYRLAATRGVLISAGGSAYPAFWDVTTAFGEAHGEAATYLTAAIPLRPTLAVRVAGKKVWGPFPFEEAAFVGGSSTLRAFQEHRFAGNSATYGNAELRLRIGKGLVGLPGDWGVFGLADAGRVYASGETSDRWHAAAGGGIWLAFLSRANTVTLSAARSPERTAFYLHAGFIY